MMAGGNGTDPRVFPWQRREDPVSTETESPTPTSDPGGRTIPIPTAWLPYLVAGLVGLLLGGGGMSASDLLRGAAAADGVSREDLADHVADCDAAHQATTQAITMQRQALERQSALLCMLVRDAGIRSPDCGM